MLAEPLGNADVDQSSDFTIPDRSTPNSTSLARRNIFEYEDVEALVQGAEMLRDLRPALEKLARNQESIDHSKHEDPHQKS